MDKIKRGFAAVKRSYDALVAWIGINPQEALIVGITIIIVAVVVF
jgi:hypothetical protein